MCGRWRAGAGRTDGRLVALEDLLEVNGGEARAYRHAEGREHAGQHAAQPTEFGASPSLHPQDGSAMRLAIQHMRRDKQLVMRAFFAGTFAFLAVIIMQVWLIVHDDDLAQFIAVALVLVALLAPSATTTATAAAKTMVASPAARATVYSSRWSSRTRRRRAA